MGKSILILDTPENCETCRLLERNCNGKYCSPANYFADSDLDNKLKVKGKPDWCPLQKIPDKKELGYVDYGKDMEAEGFNACIDEILNGHGQASGKMKYTEKLLPCPFCGGEAYFRVNTSGYQNDMRIIHFSIECQKCRTSIPKQFELEVQMNGMGELQTPIDERKEAIQAWNKRA